MIDNKSNNKKIFAIFVAIILLIVVPIFLFGTYVVLGRISAANDISLVYSAFFFFIWFASAMFVHFFALSMCRKKIGNCSVGATITSVIYVFITILIYLYIS